MSDHPRANPHGYVLLGAGGHARSVSEVIASRGGVVAALVSRSAAEGADPIIIDEAQFAASSRFRDLPVVVAIGNNATRLRLHRELDVAVRPAAIVAATASVAGVVGAGTVVHHHAHVGPAASVGEAVIVNTGAIVEHEAVVGDGAHIAPGAVLLGAARVGERAFVGSGARVLPGIAVGADAVVGAGAVVVKDVPAGATVVGVPARVMGEEPRGSR